MKNALPKPLSATWTILPLAFSLGLASLPAAGTAIELNESTFLSRTRRLIFEGKRSGEGYFSPDGRYLTFQSERVEGNPFYQIFRLDFETGDERQISSGAGKTTCSFIQPETGLVMFASTHHDPRTKELQQAELDFRASGKERRYSWDYDPEFEIYVADPRSQAESRLTHARGYDAEGSFSPDGQWIVFSSNRLAYEQPLSAERQKLLATDPSFFLDLYRMRADGTQVERLTEVDGYDGGPFYFPDGSRIIWRRFSPDGLTAEIYSAKPDGSDARQLTSFGAMSWAPYVHPSLKYLLFASNKLGFANFEIFMIDIDGKKQPVRVTYTDGFDGLPVPSPDGKKLVFTSSRHGEKGAQLYIANWNHEAALEALREAPDR